MHVQILLSRGLQFTFKWFSKKNWGEANMLNLEEFFWMLILLLYFSEYFKHVFKKLKNIPVHMKTFKPLNSLVTNSKNIGQ